jgi:hypothetical protein
MFRDGGWFRDGLWLRKLAISRFVVQAAFPFPLFIQALYQRGPLGLMPLIPSLVLANRSRQAKAQVKRDTASQSEPDLPTAE